MRRKALLVVALVWPIMVFAQQPAPNPDITISAATRDEVIEGALRALNAAYVFPEVASQMNEAIRARRRRGEYDTVTSGRQLAQLLTAHLREVSRDLHLSVDFFSQPPPTPGPPPGGLGGQTIEERQRIIFGRQNFGFARVERLAGNIAAAHPAEPCACCDACRAMSPSRR